MQVVAIVVSLVITAIALPLTTLAVRRMVGVLRTGQPVVGRRDKPVKRTVNMLIETFGHTRMMQRRWVGIMHWFVYAAFILLSTSVLQGYFQLFNPDFAWPVFGHWYPYEWLAESLGLLSTIGIIYLMAVRQRNHPRRLGRESRFFGSTFWQAYFVEIMALLEGAAILFIRGAEYKLIELYHGGEHGGRAHFPLSSFVGDALYPDGRQSLENIVFFVATFKIVLAMVWLIVIARNLSMGIAWHRFTAWPNIWFKRESSGGTALGGLQPIYVKGAPLDLENMDDLEEEDFAKLGVGKVEDFTWKGILDFSTCTECGRCQSQCPAWATDKPLSPKLLIMGLREHAYAKAPLLALSEEEQGKLSDEQKKELERPLVGDAEMYGVIDPDVLWSCTNCGACVQQCPVDIEHVDHIDDMRRFQVLVESNFPAELNNIFKGLERKGNPWGMDPKGRMDWAKKLDFEVKQVGVDVEDLDEVEWLFWVGCAGAFEDRAKKTTQAVAELLDMAGVSFAVLGDGETCTGDPARRAGNEIVFQQLAMQNAEVFKETKVKKVVSTCAHCFNSLKNEYAEFGVELEVVHHTQLLNRLVREGRLTPVAPDDPSVEKKKITYHDPCFLGRHNQVYEPPRELLQVIPGATFTEMPRNNEKSFCCGAGGARMWMEESLGSRINVNRTEEAIATGADQIAVGCPFCRIMMSDGLTLKQSEGAAREEVEVLDVAQLLLAGVKRGPAAAGGQDVVAEAEAATVTAASTGGGEGDSTPQPDADADADRAIAAAHNIAVDDKGTGTGAQGDTPRDDVAEAVPSTPDPEPVAEPTSEIKADPAEEAEPDAQDKADDASISRSEDVGAAAEATQTVEPEAVAEEGTDMPAGDKEATAWANVGPVSTDAPAEKVVDVPDETEAGQEGAREEEAEATAEVADTAADPAAAAESAVASTDAPPSGEIIAVEEAASTSEPVSEDAAPLSKANPSGPGLSESATQLSFDSLDEPDAVPAEDGEDAHKGETGGAKP